jgi:hypothetical protein
VIRFRLLFADRNEKTDQEYFVDGVAARLIASHSGTHLWSDARDRDRTDILTLRDDTAANIARALQMAVGAENPRATRSWPNTKPYPLEPRARTRMDRMDESTVGPAHLEAGVCRPESEPPWKSVDARLLRKCLSYRRFLSSLRLPQDVPGSGYWWRVATRIPSHLFDP